MEVKKNQEKPVDDNGVIIKSPFIPRKSVALGQGKFDENYKKISIVDKVKKIGEGEDDFVIEKKVIEEFTPIKEVIDADKDSVGIENIIKQVMRTGDISLLPIDKGDCNVDLVGAPESLMDLTNLGDEAKKKFSQLPPELVDGLDMKSFVDTMSQEKFDAFVKAISDRASGKKEEENGK